MQKNLAEKFLAQLNVVLSIYRELEEKSEGGTLRDISTFDLNRLITLSRAAIERVGGFNSPYQKQADDILAAKSPEFLKARRIVAVIESLRMDLDSGYIQTMGELIHGEVFGDFLEMASHLLDEGYKDASAVIAGSALEAHLRQLCSKYGISIEESGKSKNADRINSELTSASVYSKLEQKNITAWQDLRNKAAHGEYNKYVKDQVLIMIAGIQDFITRNPA